MSQFITADQPYLLLGWAASRLGKNDIWPLESVPLAAVDENGTIHAVVIYNAFYDNACSMHIATARTKRWATRETLRRFFAYPFEELGLHRINTQNAVTNVAAQTLVLKLGFQFEGVKRQGLNGEDAYMYGMLRHECRFLPMKDEHKDAQDAALQLEQHEALSDGKRQQFGTSP